MKNTYNHLIGKTKKEVLEELGYEFNFYPSEVWSYILHTNWYGRKTVLLLFFENENENEKVKSIDIKKTIWKN